MRIHACIFAKTGRGPLEPLLERVRAIEERSDRLAGARRRLAFPDPAGPPVLAAGAVHEWFMGEPPGGGWFPPMTLMVEAARLAVEGRGHLGLVWIGRRCWPYPHLLVAGSEDDGGVGVLGRSVFVDPPDAGARLWAIDMALRSPGAGAVIADAGGLSLGASRRLQLAAGAGGTLGLLARPPREMTALSAAATRWVVSPCPSPGVEPRWTVQLTRCKGAQRMEETRTWNVERSRAKGLVVVPPDVGDRPGDAPPGAVEPARRSA